MEISENPWNLWRKLRLLFEGPGKVHNRMEVQMSGNDEKVVVENVNIPGRTSRVNAPKYHAMKQAMLEVLPKAEPGLTQSEVREAVIPHLPEDLFPGGSTAGWWAKTVQLDLEAKGVVIREATKPLRWHQA
jgi:hypothetical protein